jgi:hypothetical protein
MSGDSSGPAFREMSTGVISPVLFTMMVIMALVTTAITTPLVTWVTRGGSIGDRTAVRG